MFRGCQHQWYLSYVRGLQPFRPSIHTLFGTAFHETLQNYLKVMYESSATEADKIHLPTFLKTRMIELYKEQSVEGHFTTSEELNEFFEDGLAILDFFKRKRKLFFSKKNTELVGIEVPIFNTVLEGFDVALKGFIDLVIYDKTLDKYTIYDIKTSTRGWSDYEKKDQVKVNQILFYKKMFSVLKEVPEEKIDVQFFIVRRKINENAEYPAGRIQEFTPANGTRRLNESFTDLQDFIKTVFTPEGEYIDRQYPKNPTKCRFCPYNDRPDLCNKNSS
jgi:hypothetical protein